jgi:flagellar basal body-associated protein FliL
MSITTTEVHDAPADRPAAGGRKRLVVVVPVVLLVLGAAAAWLQVFAPEADGDDAEIELTEGEIVSLEPQTTSLGEAKLHHARVAVAVVLAEGIDPAVVPPRAALLQDALLRELATMDADGIRSAEGSDDLRRRLSEDARGIWEGDQVIRVVLTELLVQ